MALVPENAKDLASGLQVAMFEKEFADPPFQQGSFVSKLTYEGSRGYVVNLANQRAQMVKPVPMDVGELENREESDGAWSAWRDRGSLKRGEEAGVSTAGVGATLRGSVLPEDSGRKERARKESGPKGSWERGPATVPGQASGVTVIGA